MDFILEAAKDLPVKGDGRELDLIKDLDDVKAPMYLHCQLLHIPSECGLERERVSIHVE